MLYLERNGRIDYPRDRFRAYTWYTITTLEGILDQTYEELSDKVFASGDSSIEGESTKFENFLSDLKAVSNMLIPLHTCKT